MKIYDKNDNILENPDLTRGYLTLDKLLVAHHEAVEAVAEVWHHEVTKVYPNGGKEVKRVIDVPAVEAKEAWDEFEDIQRYVEYTAEELAERNKPTAADRMEAQVLYTAVMTDTLLEEE